MVYMAMTPFVIFDFPSKVKSGTSGLGPRWDVFFVRLIFCLVGLKMPIYQPTPLLIVLNQHQRRGKEGKAELALNLGMIQRPLMLEAWVTTCPRYCQQTLCKWMLAGLELWEWNYMRYWRMFGRMWSPFDFKMQVHGKWCLKEDPWRVCKFGP